MNDINKPSTVIVISLIHIALLCTSLHVRLTHGYMFVQTTWEDSSACTGDWTYQADYVSYSTYQMFCTTDGRQVLTYTPEIGTVTSYNTGTCIKTWYGSYDWSCVGQSPTPVYVPPVAGWINTRTCINRIDGTIPDVCDPAAEVGTCGQSTKLDCTWTSTGTDCLPSVDVLGWYSRYLCTPDGQYYGKATFTDSTCAPSTITDFKIIASTQCYGGSETLCPDPTIYPLTRLNLTQIRAPVFTTYTWANIDQCSSEHLSSATTIETFYTYSCSGSRLVGNLTSFNSSECEVQSPTIITATACGPNSTILSLQSSTTGWTRPIVPTGHCLCPSGSIGLNSTNLTSMVHNITDCACSMGYFSSTGYASTTNSLNCSPCAPGSYSNVTGLTSCYLCEAGFYNSAYGSSSITVCELCTSGCFSPVPGNSQPCPSACPTGSTSSSGSTSLNDCICISGYFSVNGTAAAAGGCQTCGAGSVSDRPGSTNCSTCAPGSYAPNSGMTVCLSCPSSSFCDGSGLSRPCPPHSDSQTNASICYCLPGSGSPTGDASASGGTTSGCHLCGPGRYSETNHTQCQSCPMGTSSSMIGATNSSTCNPCQTNCYCPNTNSSTCQFHCPSHTFSLPYSIGLSDCLTCDLGKFSPLGATNLTACVLCRPNSYCALSLTHPCPYGSNSSIGSSSLTDCICANDHTTNASQLGGCTSISSSSGASPASTEVQCPSCNSSATQMFDSIRAIVLLMIMLQLSQMIVRMVV